MFEALAPLAVAVLLTLVSPLTHSADVAEADAARKKPLQRCDQLSDKAEIECLQKARERVIEARRKREASGKGEPVSNAGPRLAPAPAKK